MPSAVSCTGISSSTVTRWTSVLRRAEERHHGVGLGLDRPDLRQPGELVVDVEELRDPTGRRGVEHDRRRRSGRFLLRALRCAAS